MSHGDISEDIRRRVRARADNRCGYCLSPQRYVYSLLEIEHIVPRAQGGTDAESNLWLSCRLCNGFKGAQTNAVDPDTGEWVALFDPRRQQWADHFRWSDDGLLVIGVTPCGRATVLALQLNNQIAVAVRREWVSVGWHPPSSASPGQPGGPNGENGETT